MTHVDLNDSSFSFSELDFGRTQFRDDFIFVNHFPNYWICPGAKQHWEHYQKESWCVNQSSDWSFTSVLFSTRSTTIRKIFFLFSSITEDRPWKRKSPTHVLWFLFLFVRRIEVDLLAFEPFLCVSIVRLDHVDLLVSRNKMITRMTSTWEQMRVCHKQRAKRKKLKCNASTEFIIRSSFVSEREEKEKRKLSDVISAFA